MAFTASFITKSGGSRERSKETTVPLVQKREQKSAALIRKGADTITVRSSQKGGYKGPLFGVACKENKGQGGRSGWRPVTPRIGQQSLSS